MNGTFRMLGDSGMEVREVSLEGGLLSTSPSVRDTDRYLVPGFVDIHIHGGFGIDFMSADSSAMSKLADQLSEVGYEALFPTTVSASAEAVLAALENLPDDPRMPGFHLEGPFISPEFPGAQPHEAICEIGAIDALWNEILDHPKLAVVTLAPELDGAIPLIRRLSERGVRVSMGHTNSTFAEAQRGFEAGVSHATHTFNAMRGLHHREAGALGFALLEDGLAAELIYDRHHVSREASALLLKAKPKEAILAVSDGTMASGMPMGRSFEMWGHSVETRDGCVLLAESQTLAGSAITLKSAFKNLAQDFGIEPAIRACCLNPRLATGLEEDPKVWLEMGAGFNLLSVHRHAR